MIEAHQEHVRGLSPTTVTVILMDSSDLLWATTAEQVNVTRSRSPGVPGYSASPIPISNIRVRLLELQQPIMQNESMMSARLLLNIMILRQPALRRLTDQQQQRPRLQHPRAPTNTRVDGKIGWQRIARSLALQAQHVQPHSSQCCQKGSCMGWCTFGNHGQRSCSEKTQGHHSRLCPCY